MIELIWWSAVVGMAAAGLSWIGLIYWAQIEEQRENAQRVRLERMMSAQSESVGRWHRKRGKSTRGSHDHAD
jgi:hypothetical protein